MKVQIAGVKNIYDATKAFAAGADAIGVVVGVTHLSGDDVDLQTAKEIFLSLPIFVCKTLITHFTEGKYIIDLIEYLHPTAVQLHSVDIEYGVVARLKAMYPYIHFIGVVHANLPNAVEKARMLSKITDAIFTDTITKERLGGTGLTHDWNVSDQIAQLINKPLILAGGLTPENVADAIKTVNPYGVDVNSGVKTDGIFSYSKMQQFVENAKSVNIVDNFSYNFSVLRR